MKKDKKLHFFGNVDFSRWNTPEFGANLQRIREREEARRRGQEATPPNPDQAATPLPMDARLRALIDEIET